MNIGVISMRYAKAMLAFALENGEENAIYNMMLQLRHTFRNVKQLPVVLQNPSLSQNERVGLICEAVNASPLFERFARLVVKEEREELLLFIAHAYIMLYRRATACLLTTFWASSRSWSSSFPAMSTATMSSSTASTAAPCWVTAASALFWMWPICTGPPRNLNDRRRSIP